MTAAPRRVPTWLFGITSVPFGVAGAFTGTTMPFLLSKAHVGVDRIAAISALTLLPSTWQFLWAPVVDLGPRRRTWLVLVATLGAACLCGALWLPLPTQLDAFVTLTVLGAGLCGLVSSCNGGLMATALSPAAMGRAGGWLNAGNLGGGAFGAAVTLWLAGHAPRAFVGPAVAGMIIAPALVALAIPEPPRGSHTVVRDEPGAGYRNAAMSETQAPGERRTARQVFRELFRGVLSTVMSRPGWTGILICLSPVGTAVAINLFSGIAGDYHATDGDVTLVNGVANGLLTAVGSLAGGWLCDRMDKRFAYCAAGALTAVCGLAMAAAPMTRGTYIVGALAYMLTTGFCYAAFSALVLEIIGGQTGAAASTQYTLFTAAGNGAIAYVTWLDGQGYRRFGPWLASRGHHLAGAGPRGLLVTDAAANLVGIVVLLGLLTALRPRGKAARAATT